MQSLPNYADSHRAASGWSRRALGAWLGLNLLDALLTFYLLGLGGIEGNPLLFLLQTQVGGIGMLVAKLVLATVVGVAIWSRGRNDLLRIASALMGLVVAYNMTLSAYAIVSVQPLAS